MAGTQEQQAMLEQAWMMYTSTGDLPPGVPPPIAAAWDRCRHSGVDPGAGCCTEILSGPEFSRLLEANADLIEVARPFMATLRDIVQDPDFVVVLADRGGVLVEVLGGDAATHFVRGAVWALRTVGNTAIGEALSSGRPVQVAGFEHYCRAYHDWACSASPISGADGSVRGAIAVSGAVDRVHPHTLGMVVAAAKAIEGQLAMRRANERLMMQHRYQQAIVESMSDGLLVIDAAGRITYMNANGGAILGVDHQKVIGKFVGDIVDFRPVVLSVLETGQGYVDREFMVKTGSGFKHFIKTAVPIRDESGTLTAVVDTFREIKRVRKMVNQMVGAEAKFTFDDILGESPEIRECVRLARAAARSCSNVLILGESGTGKEMFAQAIHNDSDRRDGPFVALNCAALPRDLIESELFGYEEGSFTGASRGGRPGKFEMASGGTIFLDEVGEIPIDMQAKLLRVLQERKVVRLGGMHYIDCNARVIAASNKDLASEVMQGTFRRDLFYRLNVITIELPPLRRRGGDLDLLIDRLTARIGERLGRQPCSFTQSALSILRLYSWPGNVRELENVIERAINMSHGSQITVEEVSRLLHSCRRNDQASDVSPIRDLEREAIEKALRASGGNVSLAARVLKISRNTLYNKARRYNLRVGHGVG